MVCIDIDGENVSSFGADSIEGKAFELNNWSMPQEITLRFSQTSQKWKNENGGPDTWLVPEHVIPVLIASVNQLTRRGCQVHIECVEK